MKIIINTSSMVPIYEQIIDQIKTMIRKQELKQNDQLPSVRALSKELKISALTVKKAYDELEREGFTVTIHGKGSYVTAANTELMMEEQKKDVFCKPFLHKIAKSFCRLLHLHFVGNCKTTAGSYSASHKPLQIIFSCYNTRYGNGSSEFSSSCACSLK